jgi:hypothetical protein
MFNLMKAVARLPHIAGIAWSTSREGAAANIDPHSPSFCSTAHVGDERDQDSVLSRGS